MIGAISRVQQKLLKNSNNIAISTFFFLPRVGVFLVAFILDLNNLESALAAVHLCNIVIKY